SHSARLLGTHPSFTGRLSSRRCCKERDRSVARRTERAKRRLPARGPSEGAGTEKGGGRRGEKREGFVGYGVGLRTGTQRCRIRRPCHRVLFRCQALRRTSNDLF